MSAPLPEPLPKILADPGARYMLLVDRVMAELVPRFAQLEPPVTYQTHFGDLAGGPGMTIWYAFEDRPAKERARSDGLTERIRQETRAELAKHGYPHKALDAGLFIDFTSREEIETAGGEFRFLR